MDRLTKPRKLTRTSVTKICNKIENEINKEDADRQLLMAFRDDVYRLSEAIQAQDNAVISFMLSQDTSEEDLEVEVEVSESYQNRIALALVKIADFVKPKELDT